MVFASTPEYTCEIGAQIGLGYYVGDATKMIFANPQEVFGAQFRYKFDPRWAMQVQTQHQRIVYDYAPPATEEVISPASTTYQNPMWNIDVTAEYNFFRYGLHPYDSRIKPISPFISLGVGIAVCNKEATLVNPENNKYPLVALSSFRKPLVYIPIGIGMKWRFAERWQLQACWQHQIFLMDNVEGYGGELDNSHDLNGFNILNNDLTSTLTIGVVFEFARLRRKCYFCEE